MGMGTIRNSARCIKDGFLPSFIFSPSGRDKREGAGGGNPFSVACQSRRPFEHEARLKELLPRQAHLSATLDLDKSDAQAAEPVAESEIETATAPCRVPPGPQHQPLPAPQF